jgi:hypothetical protein
MSQHGREVTIVYFEYNNVATAIRSELQWPSAGEELFDDGTINILVEKLGAHQSRALLREGLYETELA